MNKELKNLIKAYEDDIRCSNFAPIAKEAIEKDLLEQLLADFATAGITISPDIVFDALCGKCIEASKKLTSEEKEKTKARAAALVNAHQILVFKALLQ